MNNPQPMVVSDPLAAFEREGMIKLIAPAKTNLFLGVGPRLDDGFHEVTTVMHTLGLHDVLHIDYIPMSDGGLELDLTAYAREGLPELTIPAEQNIAVKAIRRLAEKIGRSEDESISIRLEKHIPHEAGLGGGSSDAAAALVGAAKLWGIDPLASDVLEVAAELGSDVSFFLYGGCICLTGRGERFSHRLEPMKKPLVIIKPAGGVPSKEAYRLFDENPSSIPSSIAHDAITAAQACNVPLFNNLTEAAQTLLPEIAAVHKWACGQEGVEGILLSGSGSASIAQCRDFQTACSLSAAAKLQGWWARATTLCSVHATSVPK